ncbi:hypothetical protein CPB84DRAFT_1794614 [Gymnopilus junonius]|uniref:Uncharacterized protein n=1 Tax=Gymnopilus junonius TaxID=109634 RepID=A0A9P5NA66_GYMJU|nr:hypothetical protein CPB84DRAFT_1794614 [Gymnopilus junonius]
MPPATRIPVAIFVANMLCARVEPVLDFAAWGAAGGIGGILIGRAAALNVPLLAPLIAVRATALPAEVSTRRSRSLGSRAKSHACCHDE